MGNKVYWNCPVCNDRVWTYGGIGYGSSCWNCNIPDWQKLSYNCPRCGDKVWVHALAAPVYGQVCFNCR